MSADSQWPLQQAVYAALSGDAQIKAVLGDPARIFDHVPPSAQFPHLAIGETTAQPFDGKTEDGLDQTLTLHTWSRARGLKETKTIMAAVTAALDNQTLTLNGHALVLLRMVFAMTALDSDGLARQGGPRFRALTAAP